jgi:hypothetical protein
MAQLPHIHNRSKSMVFQSFAFDRAENYKPQIRTSFFGIYPFRYLGPTTHAL